MCMFYFRYRIKVSLTKETQMIGKLLTVANGGIYTVIIQPNVSNANQVSESICITLLMPNDS